MKNNTKEIQEIMEIQYIALGLEVASFICIMIVLVETVIEIIEDKRR